MGIHYETGEQTQQMRLDYGARTDGQPDYVGFAESEVGTGAAQWIVQKFTYDVSNQLTLRQVAIGAWDNRATLF